MTRDDFDKLASKMDKWRKRWFGVISPVIILVMGLVGFPIASKAIYKLSVPAERVNHVLMVSYISLTVIYLVTVFVTMMVKRNVSVKKVGLAVILSLIAPLLVFGSFGIAFESEIMYDIISFGMIIVSIIFGIDYFVRHDFTL